MRSGYSHFAKMKQVGKLVLLTLGGAVGLGVIAFPGGTHLAGANAILLGSTSVAPNWDYNPQGLAQAFPFTATTTGTGTSISFYIDSTSTAATGQLGLYSDASGNPGTLLAAATFVPKAGVWNTLSLPSVSVTSGSHYWLAELGTSGQLTFRDGGGTCTSQNSSQNNLNALPPTWSKGPGGPCPSGFYVSGSTSVAINSIPCTVTINGAQQTGTCSGTFVPASPAPSPTPVPTSTPTPTSTPSPTPALTPTPTPTSAPTPTPTSSGAAVYVDAASIGGGCLDSHTLTQAQSPTTPWCTLSHAVASVSSGWTIDLRGGGVYPPLDLTPPHNRLFTSAVTIQTNPGDSSKAILEGVLTQDDSDFTFNNLNFSDPVHPCSYATQNYSATFNQYCYSTLLNQFESGTTNFTFSNNNITMPTIGQQQIAGFGPISNLVFSGNQIHDIGWRCGNPANESNCNGPDEDAFWATPGTGLTNASFVNNHIYNINNGGFQVTGSNVLVKGNVIQNLHSPDNSQAHSDVFQWQGGQGVTFSDNWVADYDLGFLTSCTGVQCASHMIINGNVFVRGSNMCLEMDNENADLTVIGNTCWDNGLNNGIWIRVDSSAPVNPTGFVLEDNLSDVFKCDTGPNQPLIALQDYNLVADQSSAGGCKTTGMHDIFGQQPTFNKQLGSWAFPATNQQVDASLAPGSIGVGAGTSGGNVPTTNILGLTRTTPYNMGAY